MWSGIRCSYDEHSNFFLMWSHLTRPGDLPLSDLGLKFSQRVWKWCMKRHTKTGGAFFRYLRKTRHGLIFGRWWFAFNLNLKRTDLSFALMGGCWDSPPVFPACQKTTELRAVVFGTPYRTFLAHMLWKFQTQVTQVTILEHCLPRVSNPAPNLTNAVNRIWQQ